MNTILEMVLGFLLAVALIILVKRLYKDKDRRVWGTSLIIAALIYVVFAIAGQAWRWLPFEIGGVLFYGIFYWLSRQYSLLWLALGWGLHVGWDLIFHSGGFPGYVPVWYPGWCIGFDVAVALYILAEFWKEKQSKHDI